MLVSTMTKSTKAQLKEGLKDGAAAASNSGV